MNYNDLSPKQLNEIKKAASFSRLIDAIIEAAEANNMTIADIGDAATMMAIRRDYADKNNHPDNLRTGKGGEGL